MQVALSENYMDNSGILFIDLHISTTRIKRFQLNEQSVVADEMVE